MLYNLINLFYFPYGTWFKDLYVSVICAQESSIYLKNGSVCKILQIDKQKRKK